MNKKGVSLFDENFVNLLNTLQSENSHKDQISGNSEGNKTVTNEVSKFLEPLIRNHFDISWVNSSWHSDFVMT